MRNQGCIALNRTPGCREQLSLGSSVPGIRSSIMSAALKSREHFCPAAGAFDSTSIVGSRRRDVVAFAGESLWPMQTA
jgi:hypothetical protein